MVTIQPINSFPKDASVDNLFARFMPLGESNPDLPQKDVSGLTLTAAILLPDDESTGARRVLRVGKTAMQVLGLDEDTLFAKALENTQRMFPPVITPLHEALTALDPSIEGAEPVDVLCVTNTESAFYGAAALLYPGVIEELTERMGGGFYIIPSSVHEVLIVPLSFGGWEELEQMLRGINLMVVASDEVLSNDMYKYNAETGWFGKAREEAA